MRSESEKTGPIPERDQTYVQTFGLGLTNDLTPVVCVFLRYLSQLSPQHQRHWESFLVHESAKMHENYFKPTILGEVWENSSGVAALRLSIQYINNICNQAYGIHLFLHNLPDDVHYNLSPFMRPTMADYLSFVHELDKLISENINPKFFDGKIQSYDLISHDDGTVERKGKGTLRLLDEWLFQGEAHWPDINDARREIIEPLWPAPGSEDTKLGVLMELEVRHGAAEVYTRVQA